MKSRDGREQPTLTIRAELDPGKNWQGWTTAPLKVELDVQSIQGTSVTPPLL